MKNRLLSVLLCLCMLMSLIPATPVFSAEGGLPVCSGGSISLMGRDSECEHDYTVKVTPPTCAARGYTTYTCTKCGATVITDEVDVLPHNYINGFCTACGQRLLTVRFVCDAGVSVSVCKTPDMEGPLEDNAQTAHPINVANGQIDCSGEGEVSFIVVLQPGYELESVSAASADAYKNFKQPIETGVVNGYRLTKISDDVTVTVKVKHNNDHPDAFTVLFDCDEGVSVTTYEDQTRAGACEENATRAIARTGLTGTPDVSGKGQVNFLVVISPDYTFEGITLEPVTSFENVLIPSFLNIENGFRIIGITGDITVKVSAVKNGPQECRHDYVPKVTSPTCTEAGFTTYTCSKCGDSYVSDATAPTGHEFCDQGFCTRCGMLAHKIEFICDPGVSVNVSRTLAAGGQIDENVSVAYPRDYSSGLIVMNGSGQVNFTVSVENGYRLESVNAAPADHYRTFRPPAAQQSPGTYRLTMISGDVTVTVRSSVIDPGSCTHDYQAEVVPPSCTAGGYTTYTCSICGDSYRADEQPRIAHHYVDGVCTVCGEKRINVRIVCGEGASVTVYETRKTEGAHEDNATVVHPRSGDTGLEDGSGEGQVNFTVKLAEGYRIDGVSAAPASAYQDLLRPTDKGMTNGYRVTQIRGDLTITVKTSLAPCEHDYRAVTTPPSCTEAGYTTYTCVKCGYSYQADKVAALGHEYRSAVTQPTCTEKGFTTHACARCGDAYVDGEREALGHNYKDAVIEPTCTGRGYTTHTCTRCGDKYVDGEIAALGHDFKITVTPPNCTETGYTTYACTRCRYAYADHETPALGHDYVATVTEPTCTAKGYTTYTCSRCGDHYVCEETPALGHEFRVEVTAPTCTDRGYTIHACTRCRYAYADHETPALGHDYQAVVTPPTCTEKGYTTYTCSRCGDSYVGGEKAALGHEYHSTATQPTCTEAGCITHTCARCGDAYSDSEKPALGHNYRAVVTPPTCTEKGYTTYTCSRCGDSYVDDEIAALGHDLDIRVTSPTCTEKGFSTCACRRCGYTYTANETAALGHDYEAVVTPATCTRKGYTTYTCARCGDRYVGNEIEALDHDYRAEITDPTCIRKGYTTFTCTRCGDTYTGNETPALGHDYKAVVTPPTCTERGFTTYTCARCDDKYVGSETPVLGHAYEEAVTAPTCTEKGHTTFTCVRCGDSWTGVETAALGHDWGEGVVTVQPTETMQGERTYTCRRCNDKKTEVIQPLSHVHQFVAEVIAPTCTEQGCTIHICACGERYTDSVVPALGHQSTAVVTAPTCTAKGCTTYTCAVCGAVYTGSETDALGHDYKAALTAPTCTEKGYTTYTCSRCGDSYRANETAALGHDYQAAVTAPTCTEKGFTTHTCSRCGDRYTGDETAALGHEFATVVTAPTCTEKGYTAYACTRCGIAETGNETAALGHEYEAAVTPPTCAEEGYTTFTCTRCGDSYVGNEVPALGHKYESAVTAPTCTAAGYTTYTCSVCGDSYQDDETEALGHEYESAVTAPTCTEKGYTTFTCAHCGDMYIGDETAALGHDWGEGVVTVQPTDTEPGERVYTCARCGEKKTAMIPELNHVHSFTAVVTAASCTEAGYTTHTCACGLSFVDSEVPALGHDYKRDVTPPTCTETGYTIFTCTRCGETHQGDERGALGHDYQIEVTAPTCTSNGRTVYTCTRCGESYPGEEIEALGHDYRAVVTAPTCTEAGYTAWTCSRCQDSYTVDETPALGHEYADGKCVRCGAADPDFVPPSDDPFRFDDVKDEGQYFYEPVYWAVEQEITNGATPTTFNPGAGCTRAQVVTFLWRAAGKPEPRSNISPFDDVTEGKYYLKAVLWAMEQDITNGTGNRKFSPDATCTRGQIVTFLWRYFDEPVPQTGENPFTDVYDGQYYTEAVLWAVDQGITKGASADKFSPTATCTRGQIVTFLNRAMAEEGDK